MTSRYYLRVSHLRAFDVSSVLRALFRFAIFRGLWIFWCQDYFNNFAETNIIHVQVRSDHFSYVKEQNNHFRFGNELQLFWVHMTAVLTIKYVVSRRRHSSSCLLQNLNFGEERFLSARHFLLKAPCSLCNHARVCIRTTRKNVNKPEDVKKRTHTRTTFFFIGNYLRNKLHKDWPWVTGSSVWRILLTLWR